MNIELLTLYQYSLPLIQPLRLSRGQLEQRDILLLEFKTDKGEYWREISPLPGFSQETLCDCVEQLQSFFNKISIKALSYQKVMECSSALFPAVSWGLLSLYFLQGDREKVNICPLYTYGEQPDLESLTCVKIKVDCDNFEYNIARINELMQSQRFSGVVRLDANQQWTYQHVETLNTLLDPKRVQWIEEPLGSVLQYQQWTKKSAIAFAYDESLYVKNTLPEKADGLAALIVKPMLLGAEKTTKLISLSKAWQCNLVFSSSFESPVGMQVLYGLAEKYQPAEYHGFDTLKYFSGSCNQVLPFRKARNLGAVNNRIAKHKLKKIFEVSS